MLVRPPINELAATWATPTNKLEAAEKPNLRDSPTNPPRVQASCALNPVPPPCPPYCSAGLEPCMRSCPGACGMGAWGCPNQNPATSWAWGQQRVLPPPPWSGCRACSPPAGSPPAAHAVPTAPRHFQQIETRPRARQPKRRPQHLNLPFSCVVLRGRLGGGLSACTHLQERPVGWGVPTCAVSLWGLGSPSPQHRSPHCGIHWVGKHWEQK